VYLTEHKEITKYN